ncbi:MAG: hypothetical protein HY055_03980 [Magnetospirillum sp.]|nr:hypothetical protein [Magnetospirillum sp.]
MVVKMRDNSTEGMAPGDSSGDDIRKKRKKSREKARNASGFGRGQGFAQGFGGGFGGGFGPAQIMQMLPLIMAMGGGMPGGGVANFQLQLMMWAIETWLDYLTAMQEVFERALGRLREMNVCGGFMAADEGDDEDKEW